MTQQMVLTGIALAITSSMLLLGETQDDGDLALYQESQSYFDSSLRHLSDDGEELRELKSRSSSRSSSRRSSFVVVGGYYRGGYYNSQYGEYYDKNSEENDIVGYVFLGLIGLIFCIVCIVKCVKKSNKKKEKEYKKKLDQQQEAEMEVRPDVGVMPVSKTSSFNVTTQPIMHTQQPLTTGMYYQAGAQPGQPTPYYQNVQQQMPMQAQQQMLGQPMAYYQQQQQPQVQMMQPVQGVAYYQNAQVAQAQVQMAPGMVVPMAMPMQQSTPEDDGAPIASDKASTDAANDKNAPQ